MLANTFTTLAFLTASSQASLWVDRAPDYVRPYAIEHYANAQALTLGDQTYRFLVTGAVSDNKFSLLATNAPPSAGLGVLPHIHKIHFENFFCFKGRFQLWTNKGNSTEARLLTAGDYGSVPVGTTHTFQLLAPDTEMIGVIAPGEFDDLFYFLATENVTYASKSPYSPTNVSDSSSSGPGPEIITTLESFDVYAQLNFTPPLDLINGSSPASAVWHDGPNSIPSQAGVPYFVAANWGPKYLNNATGAWQIVQPFVTPTTGKHVITEGTITLSRQSSNSSSPTWKLNDHTAIQVLEGSLSVKIENETAVLLPGDVAFVPGGTAFQYWSVAAFTKFLYVGAGDQGLDQQLLAKAGAWEYPVFPTFNA